jgi:uncharacterized protein YnzC (UPF0291/DUF896 family)
MKKELILRLNELAKKAKTCTLKKEEENEREILRKEYIKSFRNNLKSTLDSTYIIDEKGNKKSLKKEKQK